MFTLKGRQDAFQLLLPKEFICPEIEEKYAKILLEKNSYFVTPIEFINETIQKVQVLGFDNATIQQQQSSTGYPLIDPHRKKENAFMYPSSDYSYRSEVSPIALIDRTLNITFRHTLGYLNYFLLFENFFYQYSRDRYYAELEYNFTINIFNEKGSVYSRIVIDHPLVHSMDMLDFDFASPVAQSQTFQVAFRYQNFDFQFVHIEDNNRYITDEDVDRAENHNYYRS